jgi:hypothetical protein
MIKGLQMKFNPEIEFSKLWVAYDGKVLCGNSSKKGSPENALNSYKKKIKDQVFADKVLFALIEQKKHHVKEVAKGEFVANFPMVSVWLNQSRWSIEIDKEPTHEERSKNIAICCVEGCQNEVRGPKFDVCFNHVSNNPQQKEKVIQTLRESGLMKTKSESREEWIERMKKQAKLNINKIHDRVKNA